MQGFWLLLIGCHQELEKPVEEESGLPVLVFSVDGTWSTAGEPFAYEAALSYPDGRLERAEPVFMTNLEPMVRTSAESLTLTVAGDHVITASAMFGEGALTATDTQTILAAEPAALDLQLDHVQTPAGDPILFTVTAQDRFGNPTPTDGVTLGSDSTNVVVVAPSVAATIPGVYTLAAQLGSLLDKESFRVVEGLPVELQLLLSDTDLELYETTLAEVRAWDAYDNLVTDDVDLSVTGGTHRITGDAITFGEEGWFTVTATQDGLSDSVGPFLIDSTGPDLIIDPPERGTFTDDAPFDVGGSVSDRWSDPVTLTMNGDSVAVGGGGSFVHNVTWDFGINVLDTVAVDADDNYTSDTRAVLAGDYMPYGSGIPDGVVARINESGFDTLEGIGEGLINATDLTSLVPNPAFETSAEDCFLGICVTWYSITLYVTNPYIGGSDLEIDPDAGGWLNTSFTILDPSIDWQADGTVTFISLGAAGTIYADSITVDMDLTPSVQNGQLQLSVSNVDVSASGFVFDWDSWIYDVMQFFGLDLSGLLQGLLESTLESTIQDLIPDLLGDTLSSLEIAFEIPLGANIYTFEAIPSRAAVDDLGMTLGLESYFTAEQWLHPTQGPGSLYYGYTLPVFNSSTPGMQLELSLDFMNQALYALWGGGVLDMQMDADALGLDLESIGPLLGFSDLNITTVPLLPPVIVPGTGSSLLELQLGDLELTMYDGPVDPANVALQVYVSADVELDLDVTADGLLSPTIGNIDLYFDTVVPASNTSYSADTEALLQGLLPALLPGLLSGLGAIPIPELAGFTLQLSSFSLEGAENGYFSINGDLVAN